MHLTKDIDPFELIDDSDIVLGLHSTILDYAWFQGKTIITDETAISRYLASISVDFMNRQEVEQKIEYVLKNGLKIRSLDDLKNQLEYIYIKGNGFCIDLGTIGLANDYFSPLHGKEDINLKEDKVFIEGASILANALLHGENINQAILG